MTRSSFLWIFLLCFSILSCKKDEDICGPVPDTSGISVDLQFNSLEDSIAGIETKQELVDLLTRHPVLRDYFLRRREYPNDSAFINTLFQRFSHPGFDSLVLETKRIFDDKTRLKNQFEEAFKNIKYYYPEFKPPAVYTAISGMENDLFVSDSLLIVGLDYYLGEEGKYRPRLYDYLLRRYEPEDIVPSVLLLYGISDTFSNTDLNDKTVLADMVAYGKSFYFAKQMLPCVADSVFIWYSEEEFEGAKENHDLIWHRFIEDEVLFSTSHITKQKFLGERPKTIEVGEKCPGRIGQWVGWEIVDSYMKTHPDVTLPQLMEMRDAQQLFKASGYKPGKR